MGNQQLDERWFATGSRRVQGRSSPDIPGAKVDPLFEKQRADFSGIIPYDNQMQRCRSVPVTYVHVGPVSQKQSRHTYGIADRRPM